MHDHPIFRESDGLAAALAPIWEAPLYDGSKKLAICKALCGMSIEHAASLRLLASAGLFTSALVLNRSQFEAVVRAVWTFYAANEPQLEKINSELTPANEQASKSSPMAGEMLVALSKIPAAAIPVKSLQEFKASSWSALNSYVHSSIHPLVRVTKGYPTELIIQAVKVSNALMVLTCMQVAVLTGRQELMRRVLSIQIPFKACLPAKTAASL